MAKDKISVSDLEKAINNRLDVYNSSIAKSVFKVTRKTIRNLVKITKPKAPKQDIKDSVKSTHRSGTFANSITSTVEDNGIIGSTGIWYVRGDEYRLTHLLVNGHQNRDGTRTPGNPFLDDSLEEIADKYIKEIKEAIKND